MNTWKEALEEVQTGVANAEEAAKFAILNKIDIEYYEPTQRTCEAYYPILTAYNNLKSQKPGKQSNIQRINGTETPGYARNENIDDGPTGLGI